MFIECKSRKTAIKKMPWASWIVKKCAGYEGFEYFDDYKLAVNGKISHRHLTDQSQKYTCGY